MHRTKLVITATAVALFSATGMSSAMAVRGNDNDNDKVTICHRTNSDSNPYVLITVDESAVDGEGENDHTHHVVDENHSRADIIPAPTSEGVPFCPGATTEEPGEEDPDGDEGCIASSSSGDSTQSQDGLVNVGNINLGLNNLLGNALCQSNVGNGLAVAVIGDALGGDLDGDDDSDGGCIASSDSGDSEQEQEGLVNVGNINLGLDNLLGNALCQADVLNGGAVSVIGDALAGDLDDDSDGGCIASSDSGDSEQEQEGAINVGNINVGGNNLLGNALCQADLLNGLAVSVIGTAVGTGGELLSGGPLGLLSGVGYLVPSIMADVDVVAGLLLSL